MQIPKDIFYPDYSELRGSERKKPSYIQFYYPEFYDFLQSKYPGDPLPCQLYMFYNDIEEHPKCVCGKPLEYRSPSLGFRKFCSVKCSTNSKETQQKTAATNQKKYGGTGFASRKLADKTATTMLDRYGVTNAMKSEQFKEQITQTIIDRYGVDKVADIPGIRERIKKTQEERYGGVGMASPELMERIKKTQEERYGGFGMGSEIIRKKSEESILQQHGVRYNGQRPEVIQKSRYSRVQSIRKKYPIVQAVTWRDGLKIYTCSCPHPDTCSKCSGYFEIFNEHFYRRLQDGTELCTKLLPYQHPHQNNTSVEVYIKMLLDEWGIKYVQNDRSVIGPKELDFYILSHNIAIECNGVHWHSTEYKDKKYHYNKFKECEKVGVQLLSIWEDWIVNTPQIVKSLLASKLQLHSRTIHARKCEIREVTHEDSNNFLNVNHIQGKCMASIRFGLYYDNKLVSLMTFGKKRPGQGNKEVTWELIRFCNKKDNHIPGAASRLLKHFIKTYKPDNIISFSSNDISTGHLYERLGFHRTSETQSYWYVGRDFKRHHRFSFCKAKLVKMGYNPELSETEIMRALPYYCIYDSGQIKWTLQPTYE